MVLELPPLNFDDAGLPAPFEDFTAVSVPNPHVISVVGAYSEPDLIELGKRADEVFPEGANVSFLQPLGDANRPPRRGFRPHLRAWRGPDPVLRLGRGRLQSRLLEADRPGPGAAPHRPQRRRRRRRLDPDPRRRLVPHPRRKRHGRLSVGRHPGRRAGDSDEYDADENAAYVKLDERNTTCLKSHRIETAHP